MVVKIIPNGTPTFHAFIIPIKPAQVLGTSPDALPFPYVKKDGAVRATSGATGTIVFLYFTKGAAVIDLSNEGSSLQHFQG